MTRDITCFCCQKKGHMQCDCLLKKGQVAEAGKDKEKSKNVVVKRAKGPIHFVHHPSLEKPVLRNSRARC